MRLYTRIFNDVLDGSLADDFFIRHIFMDLLLVADGDGIVDMTLSALSRRLNIPRDSLSHALEVLSSPDPESRIKDREGRRIETLDEDAGRGWRIVNHAHYQAISTKADRRERDKERKKNDRAERAAKKVETLENPAFPDSSTPVRTCPQASAPVRKDPKGSEKVPLLDIEVDIEEDLPNRTGRSVGSVDGSNVDPETEYLARVLTSWGRLGLGSREEDLAKGWYSEGVPIDLVCQSIHKVLAGYERKGEEVRSLLVMRDPVSRAWRDHQLVERSSPVSTDLPADPLPWEDLPEECPRARAELDALRAGASLSPEEAGILEGARALAIEDGGLVLWAPNDHYAQLLRQVDCLPEGTAIRTERMD